MPALILVQHPLLAHSLTILRDRTTGTGLFRQHARIVSQVLMVEATRVLVLDPMLATGGSLDDTVVILHEKGCRGITLVCIVAAPEGIARIHARYPDTTIITGAVDHELNEHKFIVPGLGDFGDRYFGT